MEELKLLLDINANYITVGFLIVFYTMEQLLSTPFRNSLKLTYNGLCVIS